jgi:hypothetical protein
MSTIQWSLYCKLGAKYSTHPTVYAMWTCGPGHIEYSYSPTYSGFNIQQKVWALLLEISRQFSVRYTANLMPNMAHILQFTLCDLSSRPYTKYFQHRIFRLQYSAEGSSPAVVRISTIQWALYCKTWSQLQHTSASVRYVNSGAALIQCIYSSAYSILYIGLNVSALLLEICWYLHACYTANFVPNTEPILRFALCVLWSRTYTIHLQLRTFRIQYSSQRISAAIGGISTIQCALHCILGAKYRAHPPVCTMWTVVPDIYNVITAPHIQASIFDWTHLR